MPTRPTPFAWNACSVVLLALILLGCEPKKPQSKASSADPTPVLVQGTIETGTDGGLFLVPCGEGQPIRMLDPEGLLRPNLSFVSLRALPPASGTQAPWTVIRINYMPREGFGCNFDWSSLRWRGMGEEPFWSATVSRNELSISVPDEGQYVIPVIKGEGTTFSGEGVELVFERRLCMDSMAGNTFGWVARLTVNGRSFQGCGFQGLGKPPKRS